MIIIKNHKIDIKTEVYNEKCHADNEKDSTEDKKIPERI